jgi:cell division protein FtsA
MQEHMQYAVGIDVGTHEVRCVIGQYTNQNERPNIVGVGTAPNHGYRKGVVVNVVEAAQAIDGAIATAERMSGQHVTGATTNINGIHISGLDSRGVVAVSGHDIGEDDILRAEEAATVVQLPPNREIIQVFARNYRLDGQDNIKDPLGMKGIRLEVDAHVVTASGPVVRNLQQLFETAKTPINQIAVGGLAAAQSVLTREFTESGSLLLDIGLSTTNMVVYEDGEVQHVAVLPVGGVNITNDLAIGLRCELNVAEKVKLSYDQLISSRTKSKTFSVKLKKKQYSFESKDIDMIIEARLEELFERVDKELKKIDRSGKLPGGVIICGGSASLKGIDHVARETLRLHARVLSAKPFGGLNDQVSGPSWATALGLMLLDQQPFEHQNSSGLTDVNRLKQLRHQVISLVDKFRP